MSAPKLDVSSMVLKSETTRCQWVCWLWEHPQVHPECIKTHTKEMCVICEQVHGACTKCCERNVYYHAMCASRAGYCMELHTYVSHGKQISRFDSYCPNHGRASKNNALVLLTKDEVFSSMRSETNNAKVSCSSLVRKDMEMQSTTFQEVDLPSTSSEEACARCRVYQKKDNKRRTREKAVPHRTMGPRQHSLEAIESLNIHPKELDPKNFSTFDERLHYLKMLELENISDRCIDEPYKKKLRQDLVQLAPADSGCGAGVLVEVVDRSSRTGARVVPSRFKDSVLIDGDNKEKLSSKSVSGIDSGENAGNSLNINMDLFLKISKSKSVVHKYANPSENEEVRMEVRLAASKKRDEQSLLEELEKGEVIWAMSSKANPPWPAIVIEPREHAPEVVLNLVPCGVCVMYFGHSANGNRDYGWVKAGMIFPFLDNVDRFHG